MKYMLTLLGFCFVMHASEEFRNSLTAQEREQYDAELSIFKKIQVKNMITTTESETFMVTGITGYDKKEIKTIMTNSSATVIIPVNKTIKVLLYITPYAIKTTIKYVYTKSEDTMTHRRYLDDANTIGAHDYSSITVVQTTPDSITFSIANETETVGYPCK